MITSLALGHKNVWKTGTPFGMLVRQDKTMARRMARWHVKMRNWHAFGTLVRKHVGTYTTLPHKHVQTYTTLARRQEWHAI